ncbi:ATP-binding cassette domain-containing protein [Kordiimonas sp. SCSIO 12610]|uniref:ATP-binding cassette domain-containing protein n=1 Tax=Kordiimonas sp. SCSIO 12610 TaxID=2829597 RepID=UPI00210CFC95|nr:ATP-binding cassette domain-containing protein [Kordiimonas sp. SCSIO 12610]UTW54361.1 ATP-binding cassette domain-containing protein [Kordiimonas sp. SCSIO 12610]
MTTKTPLIDIVSLRHAFGQKEVLSIDQWSMIKGQNQLLLGPSGSGKTTFLSIITGLLKPTSGDVFIHAEGNDHKLPHEQIEKHIATLFGIVFQDHHLISSLNLEDNLRLAQQLSQKGIDNEWSMHLLEKLGLYSRRKDKPVAFSRGEIQRAAIARAAATRPAILIADEPTSALDDRNSEQVMDILTDLSSHAGSTLLVATHDKRIMPYFSEHLKLKHHADGGQ